jgi:hypothetical protein
MAIWEAREATVNISEFLSTVQTTSTLLAQVGSTEYTDRVKDVSVTGGERDVETIPLLGENASGYSNQEIFQKSVGSLRECSMTMIYKDVDISQLGAGTVSTSSGASTYKRIQGDQSLTKKAVLISFNDGTDYVNVLLNNAYVTKLGDLKIEADGHLTQEITFKCLAKDYYEEDNLS